MTDDTPHVETVPAVTDVPRQRFPVTIEVEIAVGPAEDGGYDDGDSDPDAVRAWVGPALASWVNDYAPDGVSAHYDAG